MTTHIPLAAFRSRDFRLLWFGNFVSLTGTEMTRAAVSWHILELSGGDPLALGAIGAARLVPLVLLALGSGVLADAIDRRRLMLGAQIAMMLCSLALALTTNLGLAALWVIYTVTALAAAANTLGLPARQALIPSLVPREHLAGALSLNIVAWQLATIVGPTIGGLLIERGGVGLVYWVDVVSFTAILIALLLMRPRPLAAEKRDISLRAAIEGLRFVWRTPLIWSTMLLDFLATFFSAATTLLPIYAQSILQVGPQGLGLLYAAPSVGAVIASVICSIWGAGNRQGPLLLWAVAIYGLSTTIFGISTHFGLSLLMLAINGAADTVSMVVRGNIRNLETPDELRGRMVAVNMLFFAGGPQLGEIEAGVAARLLGTQLSVALGGLACVLMTGAVAAKVPILRNYTNGSRPAPVAAPAAAD
ncbi:MFS transporter [Chloroflexus sp.]|uniref:MFS transporter n=1 Tax=Chloroflexus sp. TaxID=1904827 RepID=UPI00298F1FDB|nr:MFS transporter [Chloroflexus sp.]MCS6887639.1 MFS transporter [Chloroflexus sp.]MDW8404749.1 MFS transporter [Chloroflexus sp.]